MSGKRARLVRERKTWQAWFQTVHAQVEPSRVSGAHVTDTEPSPDGPQSNDPWRPWWWVPRADVVAASPDRDLRVYVERVRQVVAAIAPALHPSRVAPVGSDGHISLWFALTPPQRNVPVIECYASGTIVFGVPDGASTRVWVASIDDAAALGEAVERFVQVFGTIPPG